MVLRLGERPDGPVETGEEVELVSMWGCNWEMGPTHWESCDVLCANRGQKWGSGFYVEVVSRAKCAGYGKEASSRWVLDSAVSGGPRRCVAGAESAGPDQDGDCKCPFGTRCR